MSEWYKSSYSSGGANCVEVRWKKSSYSGANNDCVECRTAQGTVHIRDTQHRSHGHLSFSPAEWRALIAEVKAGGV